MMKVMMKVMTKVMMKVMMNLMKVMIVMMTAREVKVIIFVGFAEFGEALPTKTNM